MQRCILDIILICVKVVGDGSDQLVDVANVRERYTVLVLLQLIAISKSLSCTSCYSNFFF